MPSLEKFAGWATSAAGITPAFMIVLGLVLIWIVTGSIFHYSEIWQLLMDKGTTIMTFLMVFLIQKSQNKDPLAIPLKLNELVAAHDSAGK
ncbi:MAG: low affinity iron permease family protein [Chitinophagales bacterium]